MTDSQDRKEGDCAWVRMLPKGEWEPGRFTAGYDGWRVYLTNAEGSFHASSFEIGPRLHPPGEEK